MTVRRVLHVATTLDRGGAEHALLALAGAFRRGSRAERWRLDVVYLKGPGELADAFTSLGVTVHALGVAGLRAALARSRLAAVVRAVRPDVVHSHLFKADVLAASVLGRRRPGRAALVSTKHNEDVYLESALWKSLGRAAAARADALIAITPGVERFVRRTLGDPPGELCVIPYGLADAAQPPRPAPGTGTLVCPARFEEQKDHATLLRAVARVAGRRPVRLVLLGRGPLETAIRRQAALVAGAHVEFAGFVPDVTPHLDAADAVVLASRWEGLGLVLVEAALRGRPAVATAVGGIPDVVEHDVTGLLVPPGDDAALADAIVRVLDDPALAKRLGDAARARARERFGVEDCAAATEALYVRCLEASS